MHPRAPACPPDLAPRAEFFSSKDDWLAARRSGIGGSDVAAALGLNPWKSRYALWAEKTGECEPQFDENLNTRCGNLLEPIVRTLWQEQRGCASIFHDPFWLVRHRELPFLYASLDWLFTDQDGTLGVGEAKTSGRSGAADDWKDGPPLIYQLQGQHQLLVTGRALVSYVRLVPGQHGWDLSWEDHTPHADGQEMLLRELSAFWKLVETRTPPAVDDHETTRRALRAKWRAGQEEGDPDSWLMLPAEAVEVHKRVGLFKQAALEAKAGAEGAENELIAMLKGARYGVIPGVGRYSHSCSKQPERVQVVKAHERWTLSFSEKQKELPEFGD